MKTRPGKGKGRIKMGKRGNVLDVFYIFFVIMALGIVFMLSWFIMNEIQPSLDSKLDNDVSRNATAKGLQAIASFDYLLILVMVGLLIAVMIGAYFINTHPVFFVISLIMLVLFLILVPVLANVFDAFAGNSQMAEAAEEFTVTTSFMNELPKYFVIVCALVIIILYSKFRTAGGEM